MAHCKSFINRLALLVLACGTLPAIAGVGEVAVEARLAYLAYTDGYWQVWLREPDGDTRQVSRSAYEKSRISWFPDGRHLLVNGNQGTVVKLDAESGEETEIPVPLRASTDAVIDPGGGRIAFSMSTGSARDDNDIWLMDIAEGKPRRLVGKPWLQHEPAWSADGRAVYFLSGDGGQTHDIWRVELKDGRTTQLTAGQLYNFDVAVSPGGDIAFSSNRSGNYELWLRRAGEDEARRLTGHPALDARPAWSPDGGKLAFQSTRGGVANLWLMDLASEEIVPLTDHPEGAREPAWAAP